MRNPRLITLLVTLLLLSAGSAAFAASCGSSAPGWNCNTSVTVSGSTTTCKATAVSPGGSFNIYMYGGGPGGMALHTSTAYYGSSGTKSCYGTSCSITFTYTGSARPTLCNWLFSYY